MTPGETSLKPEHIRRNFSRHAADYDRYALVQKAVTKQLLQRVPQSHIRGRVLEVGCGTGMLSRTFLQEYPGTRLILSDLAHGMSCRAKSSFPGLPVVDADAANLPFAAESFDLVLSSSVYQWVVPLAQSFAELERILRPGGHVGIAFFGEQTLYELRCSHASVLPIGQSHSQRFPNRQQVQEALQNRFDIELCESQLEIEWHAGVPELLRSLKAIGAQNASRKQPEGLASRKIMRRMYERYIEDFGLAGEIPATYEVIYLVLKKP